MNLKNILAIVDVILSLSKETQLWALSVPIGSEAMRIVKIIKMLSQSIYDFQRLNLFIPRDSPDPEDYDFSKIKASASFADDPYTFIEAKFENISTK